MEKLYSLRASCTKLHIPLLLMFTLLYCEVAAQVTLSANGPGSTYELIESKGFGIESPDCKHTSFGRHVTEVFDNTLGKNVFVFHSHHTADDDRCGAQDRVRMEIKGGAGSPSTLQHTQNQTAYYRWKFRLDAGFKPSSRFTHIFQIKAYGGDEGAPLITITPRAGSPEQMQIIHSAGEGSGSLGTVKQVNLSGFKGQWVEAYVKYKSSEGSSGTFEVVLKRMSDGATLLSYSRSGIDMWRSGASYNRPKWGVYRGKDAALRDEQVRFADFCVSESSASQCPSAISSSAATTNARPAEQVSGETSLKMSLSSFPNPVKGSGSISFTLEKTGQTNLAVFDITGKQVSILVNGVLAAGIYRKEFPGTIPAGVYLLKLVQDDKVITQKVVKE